MITTISPVSCLLFYVLFTEELFFRAFPDTLTHVEYTGTLAS